MTTHTVADIEKMSLEREQEAIYEARAREIALACEAKRNRWRLSSGLTESELMAAYSKESKP